MHFKKCLALVLAGSLALALCACNKTQPQQETTPQEEVSLNVFAPEEAMGIMSDLVYRYASVAPNVTIKVTYDDGMVQTMKIEAGYPCDVFLADETLFMDWLDLAAGEDANPNNNDKIVSDTRHDYLKGPGNDKYDTRSEEEIEENPEYISTYSVAVCRATGKSYESERFVNYLISEDAREVYEAYGYELLD